ncbi:hypothetical protein R3P38DRAFT_2815341 [Favolaschia claudopus]|uniref:Uncharacterized protein n=1 Tax=Favolaschia claudopus TaxID=2862362 RepID=A0AAV9Z1F3_9AGAR
MREVKRNEGTDGKEGFGAARKNQMKNESVLRAELKRSFIGGWLVGRRAWKIAIWKRSEGYRPEQGCIANGENNLKEFLDIGESGGNSGEVTGIRLSKSLWTKHVNRFCGGEWCQKEREEAQSAAGSRREDSPSNLHDQSLGAFRKSGTGQQCGSKLFDRSRRILDACFPFIQFGAEVGAMTASQRFPDGRMTCAPSKPGTPAVKSKRAPADCGALAVNMIYRRLTLIQTFKVVPSSRRCGAGGNVELERAATTFSVKGISGTRVDLEMFLAAFLLIERFTAVAGNDSNNTIGVRKGPEAVMSPMALKVGGGAGLRQPGSSGGRASAVKIACISIVYTSRSTQFEVARYVMLKPSSQIELSAKCRTSWDLEKKF